MYPALPAKHQAAHFLNSQYTLIIPHFSQRETLAAPSDFSKSISRPSASHVGTLLLLEYTCSAISQVVFKMLN